MRIGDVTDLYFSDPTGVRAKSKTLTILCAHLAGADSNVAISMNSLQNSWRRSFDLNSGS